MIRVRYRPGRTLMLTAEGHAGAASFGRDLVCAACTVLVRTLAANVQALEADGRVSQVGILLDRGYARIRCTPLPGARREAEAVFETLGRGFRLLEGQYPAFLGWDREEEEKGV